MDTAKTFLHIQCAVRVLCFRITNFKDNLDVFMQKAESIYVHTVLMGPRTRSFFKVLSFAIVELISIFAGLLWIRFHFFADPDPAVFLNAECCFKTADPDPALKNL